MKKVGYMQLVRRFRLRRIQTERDLTAAIKVIDSLIDSPSLNPGAKQYLDALSYFVEDYEKRHYPMPKVSDARLFQHLIEAREVTKAKVFQEAN